MTTPELIALLDKLDKEAPPQLCVDAYHQLVTLRNNLNTIVQWGRVVEWCKRALPFIYSEFGYTDELEELLSSLDNIEE